MVRRSFRLGLRLGLLAGVIVAVVKVVQSRRSGREEAWAPPASHDPWPPMQPDPVTVEPVAPTVAERIPPVRKAAVEPTPSPVAAPAPADSPPSQAGPDATKVVGDWFDEEPGTGAASVVPMAPAPPAAEPPGPAARPARKAAARKAAAAKAAPAKAAPVEVATTVPAPARTRVRKSRRQPWVDPEGHDAPTSHPVKAKLSSMLYHLPGMAFYNRTRPDRCYVDAEAAEADGFTRAKR